MLKITKTHDQNSIDPSAQYSDDDFAIVLDNLEREYERAILAQYPDAEIDFEHRDMGGIEIWGIDDPDGDIAHDVQDICASVFETGLFWI
jgi:hypothetical protein